MAHLAIVRYGLGRYTEVGSGRAPLGSARDAVNVHFNKGLATAKLRVGVDRIWSTRIAGTPTLAAYELVLAAGTRYLLAKHGTSLYTFDLTPTTALGSILASMAADFIPSICTANGTAFIADSAANYLSRGTTATTYELQKTAPTGSLGGASSVGTAVGNVAGTIYFSYTYSCMWW